MVDSLALVQSAGRDCEAWWLPLRCPDPAPQLHCCSSYTTAQRSPQLRLPDLAVRTHTAWSKGGRRDALTWLSASETHVLAYIENAYYVQVYACTCTCAKGQSIIRPTCESLYQKKSLHTRGLLGMILVIHCTSIGHTSKTKVMCAWLVPALMVVTLW